MTFRKKEEKLVAKIVYVGIDFTEDLRFKLMCFHTIDNVDGISYNPVIVLRDIINTFGSILTPAFSVEEDELIPKLLPNEAIKKIRSVQKSDLSKDEIANKIQSIISDGKAFTKRQMDKWLNLVLLEMQTSVTRRLIFRAGKGMMMAANEMAYDSANYQDTAYAITFWLLSKGQIPQFKDEVVVKVMATGMDEAGENHFHMPELGYSVLINLRSPKLRTEAKYTENVRLQMWLDFLLEGKLDLDDPVFSEIYKLCRYLRFNKEASEVSSMYYDYAAELKLDYKEEGREEGLEEGIEIGREEGREEGLEEGIEIGREEGREEGLEEGIEIGRAMREVDLQDRIEDERFEAQVELLYSDLGYTPQQIADKLKVSIRAVECAIEKLNID